MEQNELGWGIETASDWLLMLFLAWNVGLAFARLGLAFFFSSGLLVFLGRQSGISNGITIPLRWAIGFLAAAKQGNYFNSRSTVNWRMGNQHGKLCLVWC